MTEARPLPWVAASAAAYGVMHHLGVLMSWAGGVGVTRWADWADLLTPYAVLLPAGVAMWRNASAPEWWVVYAVGAVTYVEGHGIHLAANSIANVAPGDAAHLWDEVVGHYIWYAGVALVAACLVQVLAEHAPRRSAPTYALAALVGVTHATNSLEGGTPILGLVVALAFVAAAARSRALRLVLLAYALALVVLGGYGVWQRGFPQPSELGWY